MRLSVTLRKLIQPNFVALEYDTVLLCNLIMESRSKQKPRNTTPLTMSFPPEVVEWMDNRVRQLRPKALSRSHYVQLLIDADKRGLVFPKARPALQLAGFAA